VQIFTALQFILSKIGAVIAQFGRQFDENAYCLFWGRMV
jgi:hypothetical protein